ncbi:hypothetical protein [Microlunatus soli]|uniref:CHAP domain-containing protein n=1 Tax=Microlunatus soli TaxID=630515 RepID=A0A1H1S4E8_9ACTN|nr:hypothetical protein [Microlunatus soli]SDS42616.1 hypothetical protein SAMN04489812_1872 [Microlunatus soli]
MTPDIAARLVGPHPRRGRAIVVALLTAALTAAGALTAPSATAVPTSMAGTVAKDGDGLVIKRAAPHSKYHRIGTLKAGTKVTILCQTAGESRSGPRGSNNVWDFMVGGYWLPDVEVRNGHSPGYVVDRCNGVGAPPRANPYTADWAISRAFQLVGSTSWENECLIFARNRYGWLNGSGWRTAEIGGDYFASRGMMHQGVPPRGALVWYHNSSGTGHVAISLGEGRVIGTSVNGRVGVALYTAHSQLRGWSKAYFPAAS